MRLYRMELFKICTRKLFLFGAAGMIGITLLYFLSYVSGAESTINGVRYRGYEAIIADRRITQEFQGILTDEKVGQIVKKYGFPKEAREGINMFVDTNYLNGFVMYYLSDGYMRGWDDYQVATCTYPIAETQLGEMEALTGREMILEYHYGWGGFINVLNLGFILVGILVIFGISPIFAEESHIETLPLLFTAKEGKGRDIRAKIAAGLTVAAASYLAIVLMALALCGMFFGFGGLESFTGLIFGYLSTWFKTALLPVKGFILLYLLFAFVGQLELCAVTMLLSAWCKSPFHVVVADALLWVLPILLLAFSGRVSFSMRVTPLYLIMPHNVYEIRYLLMLPVMVGIALGATIACLALGYRKYKNKE